MFLLFGLAITILGPVLFVLCLLALGAAWTYLLALFAFVMGLVAPLLKFFWKGCNWLFRKKVK